jgi:hypothetical protein
MSRKGSRPVRRGSSQEYHAPRGGNLGPGRADYTTGTEAEAASERLDVEGESTYLPFLIRGSPVHGGHHSLIGPPRHRVTTSS